MEKGARKSTAQGKEKHAAKREGQEKAPLKRPLMGEEAADLTELGSGSPTILDSLSPTAVDTKSHDYIMVDGVFSCLPLCHRL